MQSLKECEVAPYQAAGSNPCLDEIPIAISDELSRASELLRRYGSLPADFLRLSPPKKYFFSTTGCCVVTYAVANDTAVALGDPVGPEQQIEPAIEQFVRFCRRRRWKVAFYKTTPDFLRAYQRLQLRPLKIGDDAIIELSRFSLRGRSKRDIRSKARTLETEGYKVVLHKPPLSGALLAELKNVSDEWLSIPGRRERTFAVGYFDFDYLRSTSVLTAVNRHGKILAFVNLIRGGPAEVAGDVIRRRNDAPNGITDYLLLKLIHYAKEMQYPRVSLGLAPMTGFRNQECASIKDRVIHALFRRFNFLFSFEGLYRFKAKFATSWEPRYLIYERVLDLPRTALALRRLMTVRIGKDSHLVGRDRFVYDIQ